MIRNLLIFCFLCSVFSAIGQINNFYKWVKPISQNGSMNYATLSTCQDNLGNIYLLGLTTTGGITGNLDFGNGVEILNMPSGYPFFAKFSSNGTALWIKKINISTSTTIAGFFATLLVDTQGNILIAGSTVGNIDFNNDGIMDITIPSQTSDSFVAKLSTTGDQIIWTKVGNSNDSRFRQASLDNDGNVIIMGYVKGNINFGNTSLNFSGSSSSSTGASYLCKISGNTGAPYWLLGDHETYPTESIFPKLEVDNNNDVYFMGDIQSRISLKDPITQQYHSLDAIPSGSQTNVQILYKISSSSGSILLAKRLCLTRAWITSYKDYHVSKNNNGSNFLYISGNLPRLYNGSPNQFIAFDGNNQPYGVLGISPTGIEEGFVAKFDLMGNLLSVKLIPSVTPDTRSWGYSVKSSSNGDYYVIGHYNGAIVDNEVQICSTEPKTYIAKYSSNNLLLWIRTADGIPLYIGNYNTIMVKSNGSLCFFVTSIKNTLYFNDIVVINPNTLIYNTFIGEADSGGGNDIFNVSITTTNAPKVGQVINFSPVVVGTHISMLQFNWEIINSEGNILFTSNQNNIQYIPNVGGANYSAKLTATVIGCSRQTTAFYSFTTPPPLCATNISQGSIFVNQEPNTGSIQINYNSPSCGGTIPFDCMGGNPNGNQLGAISASASILQSEWVPISANTTANNYNPYEEGHRGRYYAKRAYTFNTQVPTKNTSGNDLLNYELGTFSYVPFNWQSKSIFKPTKWLAPTEVEQYSLNGEALQEKNMLGTQSCAKFGYKGALAYMIAKNASQREVMFESFENVYPNNLLEDNLELGSATIEITKSHSGNKSVKMSGPNYQLKYQGTNNGLQATNHIKSKGLLVKFWLHTTEDNITNDGSMNVELLLGTSVVATKNIKIIAQTGLWRLCEATFTPSELNYLPIQSSFSINIKKNITGDFWIDDVAAQPYDAEIVNYVYDPKTLRLLASLDSQHFGMYYLYNDEGKLVRKQIETERGLKTIQETQYNTPKQNR